MTMGDETALEASSIWSTYHLLVILALALTAGRISVVTSREGDTAFLSANDRSRWATVASLVERGTFVIDEQIAIANPIYRNRRPWNSIDKVRHLGSDGQQHYYSSKPPLLATMVAGLYWIVNQASGITLTQHPLYMPRLILLLFNLPLLVAFFYATIATTHRLIHSSWGRTIAAASICFGTMILPFSISLNNHLPACTATAIAMWIYFRSTEMRRPSSDHQSLQLQGDSNTADSKLSPNRRIPFSWAVAGGIAATFAAANELPALSMTAFWALLFFVKDRTSVLPFAVGSIVVAAAFFGTNWIAHQSLRPPYAHRGNGELIATLQTLEDSPSPKDSTGDVSQNPLANSSGAHLKVSIEQTLSANGDFELPGASPDQAISIFDSDENGRWMVKNGEVQYALLLQDQQWNLYRWDDWYEYPGTYWKDGNRQGVDRGEASKSTYLMNLTIGHHGIFSLTPIWLLIPFGWILGIASSDKGMRRFYVAIFVASSVCFLFYLNRPLIDRNYGGVSACFRWLLWFSPLWLASVALVLDRLGKWQVGRLAASSLLAMSLFSVSTALQNPWQSPWIYRFWLFLGWIEP